MGGVASLVRGRGRVHLQDGRGRPAIARARATRARCRHGRAARARRRGARGARGRRRVRAGGQGAGAAVVGGHVGGGAKKVRVRPPYAGGVATSRVDNGISGGGMVGGRRRDGCVGQVRRGRGVAMLRGSG